MKPSVMLNCTISHNLKTETFVEKVLSGFVVSIYCAGEVVSNELLGLSALKAAGCRSNSIRRDQFINLKV